MSNAPNVRFAPSSWKCQAPFEINQNWPSGQFRRTMESPLSDRITLTSVRRVQVSERNVRSGGWSAGFIDLVSSTPRRFRAEPTAVHLNGTPTRASERPYTEGVKDGSSGFAGSLAILVGFMRAQDSFLWGDSPTKITAHSS